MLRTIHIPTGNAYYGEDAYEDASLHARKASYQSINLLVEQNNLVEAEAQCRENLDKTPLDSRYRTMLGMVLTLAGRFEEAIQILRAGVEQEPHSPCLRINLAKVFAIANQNEAAKVELHAAIEAWQAYVDARPVPGHTIPERWLVLKEEVKKRGIGATARMGLDEFGG